MIALPAAGRFVPADGEEQDLAPLCVLRWDGGAAAPAPAGVRLSEFFAPNIQLDAARGAGGPGPGPWLVSAGLPAWSVIVAAHRLAADDHIKVITLGEDGRPAAADLSDDRLAIRVPNASGGDSDNYVVGLGLDLTAGGAFETYHPTEQDAPDLPPQPLLLVATSDGVLRVYTFGNYRREGCLVGAPQPAPPPPPALLPPAAAAEVAGAAPAPAAAAEERAAATSLPEEESDFEEEGEEGVRAAWCCD